MKEREGSNQGTKREDIKERERETEGGFIGEDRERRRERLRGLHRGRERERESLQHFTICSPEAAMFRGGCSNVQGTDWGVFAPVQIGITFQCKEWEGDFLDFRFSNFQGNLFPVFSGFFRYSTSPPQERHKINLAGLFYVSPMETFKRELKFRPRPRVLMISLSPPQYRVNQL